MYKEDKEKQELDVGLDKTAVVELVGSFPSRKLSPLLKRTESSPSSMEVIDATFFDYSTEKGIWRFELSNLADTLSAMTSTWMMTILT